MRQGGVSEPVAVASQIVDLTTEMASQLIYTIFGAAMLTALLFHVTSGGNLLWTAGLALLLGGLGLAAIGFMHGRGLDFVGALASRWIKDTQARADAVKAVIREIYGAPWRLASGFLLNALCWVLSGAGSWVALSLMGFDVALWKILTLESLIAVVKSVAFFTPGALGIQEGAYVLIASVFGLSGEATLSLSLLRRAKDLVIGIPAILAWQWSELACQAGPEAGLDLLGGAGGRSHWRRRSGPGGRRTESGSPWCRSPPRPWLRTGSSAGSQSRVPGR